MPNRYTGDSKYRYGFQGQEQDNEIKGQGNSVNYKYRMHDARIGRFFATDPLASKYPYYSPYQFSGNRVIDRVELEGLEPAVPKVHWGKNTTSYSYNTYGYKGHLRKIDGWWVYSRMNQNHEMAHKYFDYAAEKWVEFEPMPSLPAKYADGWKLILSLKGIVITAKEVGHESLDGIGMLPLLGELADGINALWYYAEGDNLNGSISLAGMIPFGGMAATGTRLGLKIFKNGVETVVDNMPDFYKAVNKLDIPERIAKFKDVGKQVAKENGWVKNKNLMKKNGNKYEIYTDRKSGMNYSLDTQHGTFEVLNKKGKHQGEVDFSGKQTKTADKSGGHDIIVK
jgi:RHS repeat-associated protein